MRAARWTGPLLLLATCGLAGCGSSGDEEAAADDPAATAEGTEVAAIDPCSLVTGDEVAEAIGEKVVAAKADGDSCAYETEDAQASSVTVQVKPQGGAEEMEAIKGANAFLSGIGNKMKDGEGAAGDVGETLAKEQGSAGVGDDSVFDASGSLHVRKGDAYVMVAPPIMRSRMSGGNPLLSTEQRQEIAAAIARKAIGKL